MNFEEEWFSSEFYYLFTSLQNRMERQNEDHSNNVPIIEDLDDVESFILKVYKSFPFIYKNTTNQYLGNIYLFMYSHVAYSSFRAK